MYKAMATMSRSLLLLVAMGACATMAKARADAGEDAADGGEEVLSDVSSGGSCSPPVIVNGQAEGSTAGDMYVARVSCSSGFALVGVDLVKCMHGVWNAKMPVCAKPGGCPFGELPRVVHGRVVPTRGHRGAVYAYKCDKGFRMWHEDSAYVHCVANKWSNNTIVCAKRGCDESLMPDSLASGQVEKLLHGAVLRFSCASGAVLRGARVVHCDGNDWSHPPPLCHSRPSAPSLTALLDGEQAVGSVITVESGQSLGLVCSGSVGTPEPELLLVRDSAKALGKPRTGTNAVKMRVAAADNGAVFRCDATNGLEATASNEVKLNVLFAAARVSIGGPRHVQPDAHHRVVVTCTAEASNPPAHISFVVTDVASGRATSISMDDHTHDAMVVERSAWSEFSEEARGHVASARLVLDVADVAKKGVRVTCVGANQVSREQSEDSIVVAPEYSPEHVTISGPSKIRSSAPSRFTCTSGPAFPAAKLSWKVSTSDGAHSFPVGKAVKGAVVTASASESTAAGFVTTSTLELTPDEMSTEAEAEAEAESLAVECAAQHQDLGADAMTFQHHVNVISPPGQPSISGVERGEQLRVGASRLLTCEAKPKGNPPADIAIFVADSLVESRYSVDGDAARAQIEFVPRTDLDGSQIRCEAYNEAIGEPVASVMTIGVAESPSGEKEDANDIYSFLEGKQVVLEKKHFVVDDTEDAGEDAGVDDKQYDYDDEAEDEASEANYSYVYPEVVVDERSVTHPEFLQEDVYKLKKTTTASPSTSRPRKVDPSLNEVYPKDSPYTSSGVSWRPCVASVVVVVLAIARLV